MKRILVYGIAGWEPENEAKVVLDEIRRLGYRSIFFCDRENPTMAFADRSVVNSDWSYGRLLKVAQEEAIDLAMLIVDFASPLVGRLNRELHLPGPTDIQYDMVSDKSNWSRLALEQGVKMPAELLITDRDQFREWPGDGPIFVKPTKSTGNVSREPFGYRYFDSIEVFEKFLDTGDLMSRFLRINQTGSSIGRYVVQERLDYKFWGNLGLTFVGGRLIFNETHDRMFHDYPHQTHQYESRGPVRLSEVQKAQADKIGGILRDVVGFKNTGLNIDLIETKSGEIFTIDINVRFGSTWTTFLPLRNSGYMGEAMKAFMGLEHDLSFPDGAFLRRKLDFPSGVIRAIDWPHQVDSRLKLVGREHGQPGREVPSATGRHTWPVETLVAAESLEECDRIASEFRSNIRIEMMPS